MMATMQLVASMTPIPKYVSCTAANDCRILTSSSHLLSRRRSYITAKLRSSIRCHMHYLQGGRFMHTRTSSINHEYPPGTNTLCRVAAADQQISDRYKPIEELVDPSTTLQLPPIRSAFPVKSHPDFESIKDECDAWFLALIAPVSEQEIDFIMRCQLALLAGLSFPGCCSTARLITLVKFTLWLFVFDDTLDLALDSGAAEEALDHVRSIFQTKQAVTLSSSHRLHARQERFLEAQVDLWNELCSGVSPMLEARLLEALLGYVDSLKLQLQLRIGAAGRQVQQLQEYIVWRRQTGFVICWILLVEYCLGVELDEEATQSETMKQLHLAIADHIIWANDLLSFRKEYMRGDNYNLVSVLCTNNSCSFQEAIYEAWKMIKGEEDRSAELMKQMRESKHMMQKPGMTAYLDAMGYLMAGSMCWCCITARYNPTHPLPWGSPSTTVDLRPDATVDYSLDMSSLGSMATL